MKKYHFDKVVNRRNLNSYKWDVGEDELPMWVADMDFDTAPEIKCAIQTRLNQGALGYNTVPASKKVADVLYRCCSSDFINCPQDDERK